MTKQEFKKIIPKASAELLKNLGFGYIVAIKRTASPIWMQIPYDMYDAIPTGFPIVTKYRETEKFDPELHKRKRARGYGMHLEIGILVKDTLSPIN